MGSKRIRLGKQDKILQDTGLKVTEFEVIKYKNHSKGPIKIEVIIFNPDINKLITEYNEEGDEIKNIEYMDGVIYTTEYEYYSNGVKKTEKTHDSGEQTTSITDYDINGNEIDVRTYNINNDIIENSPATKRRLARKSASE